MVGAYPAESEDGETPVERAGRRRRALSNARAARNHLPAPVSMAAPAESPGTRR
jgi:hypothetical protein